MKTLTIWISLCFIGFPMLAQHTISGIVTDQREKPLERANVILTPGSLGAITNSLGEFTITNVPEGTYTIKASYIGYVTYEEVFKIEGNRSLEINLAEDPYIIEGVTVQATRVDDNSPAAFVTLSKEELSKRNLGQDFPYLLDNTPGVVTFSDAGAGVGYSGLRIRGSDPTRINVTINGIPLNDSESQAVYWVDLPDFASSVQSVQIQRGIGTSSNGSGAFGASINIETELSQAEPMVQISNTVGSFNTRKHTLHMSTGRIKDRLNLSVRLSEIASDGYIDRASSKLRSFFVSGSYLGEKSQLKVNIFSGKEVTYQAWDGVSESDLELNRTFNVSGQIGPNQFYDNQVDDYQQNHYQLHYSYEPWQKLELGLSFHYTKGFGFYEQYRVDDSFSDYGLSDVIIGGTTITSTDLVRRRWLDNDFYGTTFSAIYTAANNLKFTFGGSLNNYDGDHYGEIIWARYANSTNKDRYYQNTGTKFESNYYLKSEFSVSSRVSLFGDIQLRNISYKVNGIDNDQRNLNTKKGYSFINPKIGISYRASSKTIAYLNYSNASREPVRNDFIDAPDGVIPKAESMHDLEGGIRFSNSAINANLNLYSMIYKDQLVLTGELNDVGSPIRRNVDKSHRTGAELSLAWMPGEKVKINGSLSYSINKIDKFDETAPIFDPVFTYLRDTLIVYENTDIVLSPNMIGYAGITYFPFPGLELTLDGKYVSDQFLDNKSNDNRKLDSFFINNLQASYSYQFKKTFIKELKLNLLVNNLFNIEYEPHGYTYFILFDDGNSTVQDNYNYYYPQAGINFLAGLQLTF